MCGFADDRFFSRQHTGVGNTHIILSDMRAIRGCLRDQLRVIIKDEGDLMGATEWPQLACQ
jgi:hypothetical protein